MARCLDGCELNQETSQKAEDCRLSDLLWNYCSGGDTGDDYGRNTQDLCAVAEHSAVACLFLDLVWSPQRTRSQAGVIRWDEQQVDDYCRGCKSDGSR